MSDDQPRRLNQNQTYGKNIGSVFAFTGKDIVVVRAKGAQVGGHGLLLELIVNDQSKGTKVVNKNTLLITP